MGEEHPGKDLNTDGSEAPFSRADTLFEEYLTRTRSGEEVSVKEYLERYPELESELRARFARLGDPAHSPGSRPVIPGPAPEPGEMDKRLGDFRIIRKIGEGGMGAVYEAEQISLKRRVALKFLPSHLSFSDLAVKKFQREAEAGGRQHHPGIVAVYAVGEHQGDHYIAQELVEGGRTLADRLDELKRDQAQPVGYFREAADLIARVADALQHAHDAKVIHRDIKPANIMLDRDDRPKVTDFGLAKVEDALELSRTGEFAGTPYYMSPEQALSRRIGIDHRTDVYSLGVTLYEMLTLKRPFEGRTSQDILKKIIFKDPEDPHRVNLRVPRDLAVISLKAMEKEPNSRYQTMVDFAEDLRRYLAGEVVLAKPSGPATRIWKRVKRNPVVSSALGVAMAAVVALLVLAVYSFFRDQAYIEELRVANEEVRQTNEELSFANEEIRLRSDMNLIYRLEAEADELWPAYPEKIRELKRWLDEARRLADGQDMYRQRYQALAAMVSPSESEDDSDDEQEVRYGLERLLGGIDSLLAKEGGLIPNVEKRLDFANRVYRESIERHQGEWDLTVKSITGSPKYGGIRIKPQVGFVPIGQDPSSKLFEFAHLQTGEPPRRDAEERLVLTEETGLVFVLVPGGTFKMGAKGAGVLSALAPNGDPNAEHDESPIHEVTVEPFFLSKYEMNQGQWLRVTGDNPSSYHPGYEEHPIEYTLLHPVESVTWDACDSVLTNLKLRLPSEGEWEYAARSGKSTIWWTGGDEVSLQGVANLADRRSKERGGPPGWPYQDFLEDDYIFHAPVGCFAPNRFGLHDVYGNVWEICKDDNYKYGKEPRNAAAVIIPGSRVKIGRGASYVNRAMDCRSANRDRKHSGSLNVNGGLRPAYTLK